MLIIEMCTLAGVDEAATKLYDISVFICSDAGKDSSFKAIAKDWSIVLKEPLRSNLGS